MCVCVGGGGGNFGFIFNITWCNFFFTLRRTLWYNYSVSLYIITMHTKRNTCRELQFDLCFGAVILYCWVKCTVLYRIVSYRIASYRIVSYLIVSYSIILYLSYCIVWYWVILVILYCIVLYCIILVILYRIVLYCIILVILYRIVLYYTCHIVLYRMVLYFCILELRRLSVDIKTYEYVIQYYKTQVCNIRFISNHS